MNFIKIVISVTMLTLFLNVNGGIDKKTGNIVDVHHVYADPADRVTVDVEIINDDPFIAFQMDFYIPGGFTYVEGSAVLSDRAPNHNLSANVIDGEKLRLLSYAMPNEEYLGNSGIIVSFDFDTPDTEDIWQLIPEDVVLTSNDHKNIYTGYFSGSIVLGSPKAELTLASSPDIPEFELVGEGSYDIGELVNLSATGFDEYIFDYWSGDDEDTVLLDDVYSETTFFEMPPRHISLTANFKLKEYKLDVEILPEETGQVTVRPEKEYFHKGEEVTLVAYPAEGCEFEYWSYDNDQIGTDDQLIFTMPGEEVVITANFSYIDYTITLEASPEYVGTTSVDPDQEYYHIGDVVKIEAIAYEGQGGKLYDWTDKDGTQVSTSEVFLLFMGSSDVYLRANFIKVAEILSFKAVDIQVQPEIIDSREATVDIIVDFESDLTSVDPQIITSEDSGYTPEGVVDFSQGPVTYTVVPDNENISPKEWTVSVEHADPTEADIYDFDFYYEGESAGVVDSVIIDDQEANVDVFVNFSTNIEVLTPSITISYKASINPEPATGDFSQFGETLKYIVTSFDEEHHKEWPVTVYESPNTETDIIDFVLEEQDAPAVIDYEKCRVDIEVVYGTDVTSLIPAITVSENATIEPESGVEHDFTDPVLYTVYAEDGVSSQVWIVEVSVVELAFYELELVTNPTEGGIVSGGGEYLEGEEVEVTATTFVSHKFINWTYENNDNVSENEEFTFTMPNEDVTLVANFEELTYNVVFETLDNETGQLITDAKITLGNITNDENNYLFKDVSSGLYNYNVLADGYFDVTGTISVVDDDVYVTVKMESYGPNIVNIPNVNYKPGEPITVKIDVENVDEIVAFQMDIEIPSGFKKVYDSGQLSDRAGDHYLITELEDSLLTLFSYSITNTPYKGNSGMIVSFELKTPDEEGQWFMMPENTILARSPSQDISTGSFGGVIILAYDYSVESYDSPKIVIYPNPANEKLTIESDRNIKQVRLIDLRGQVLLDKVVEGLHTEINVNSMDAGIYFISIYTENSVQTRRVKVVR